MSVKTKKQINSTYIYSPMQARIEPPHFVHFIRKLSLAKIQSRNILNSQIKILFG